MTGMEFSEERGISFNALHGLFNRDTARLPILKEFAGNQIFLELLPCFHLLSDPFECHLEWRPLLGNHFATHHGPRMFEPSYAEPSNRIK